MRDKHGQNQQQQGGEQKRERQLEEGSGMVRQARVPLWMRATGGVREQGRGGGMATGGNMRLLCLRARETEGRLEGRA